MRSSLYMSFMGSEKVLSVSTGEENGTCVNLRCPAIRTKAPTKSNWFHMPTKSWICFSCAQKMNAQAARYGVPKEALTAPEYLVELLRN
jgi:hypothetical protein